MSQDEVVRVGKSIIQKLEKRKFRTNEHIALQSKNVVKMDQSIAYYVRLVDNFQTAPPQISSVSPEMLLGQLQVVDSGLDGLPDIADRWESTGLMVEMTMSGTAFIGQKYVDFAASQFPEVAAVVDWSKKTYNDCQQIGDRDMMPNKVAERLKKLSPGVASIYLDTRESTSLYVAGSGLKTLSDAANAQRNLLLKFNGELDVLCKPMLKRKRKKNELYEACSECLSLDNPLAKKVVSDGGLEYKDLHDLLSDLSKERVAAVNGNVLTQTLERIEGLIMRTTSAFDPAKSGITFDL